MFRNRRVGPIAPLVSYTTLFDLLQNPKTKNILQKEKRKARADTTARN